MQPQRQSLECSPNSSQHNNGDDYYDNHKPSSQSFDPNQQRRSVDISATPYPPEFWYLNNNNNELARLPNEYANMRGGNPGYERQAAPVPQYATSQYAAPQYTAPQYAAPQHQGYFDYPQQQQRYVVEGVMEPKSRSPVSSDQIQQGLGFLMNAGSKGRKRGKKDKKEKKGKKEKAGKLLNVLSLFSN